MSKDQLRRGPAAGTSIDCAELRLHALKLSWTDPAKEEYEAVYQSLVSFVDAVKEREETAGTSAAKGSTVEAVHALRDQWRLIDEDYREGRHLLTCHSDAFDDGFLAAQLVSNEQALVVKRNNWWGWINLALVAVLAADHFIKFLPYD